MSSLPQILIVADDPRPYHDVFILQDNASVGGGPRAPLATPSLSLSLSLSTYNFISQSENNPFLTNKVFFWAHSDSSE